MKARPLFYCVFKLCIGAICHTPIAIQYLTNSTEYTSTQKTLAHLKLQHSKPFQLIGSKRGEHGSGNLHFGHHVVPVYATGNQRLATDKHFYTGLL